VAAAGEEEAEAAVVGPAGEAKDEAAGEEEGEGPGQRAAEQAETGPVCKGCRLGPGARSAHALPVIRESPISPASPASIGIVRTAGPA